MIKLALRTTLVASLLALGSAASADEKLIQECMDCHGKDGVSTESDVPEIAGFSAYYMSDALGAYADGDRPAVKSKFRFGDTSRPETDMVTISKNLSEDQIKEVGKFFAGKKFAPRKQPFDAAKAAEGEKLHEHHCKKCHSAGGTDPTDDAGILAGQWTHYIEHAFKTMRSGKRAMDKKMKPKIEELSDAEIEALVQYYASQQ